MNPFALYPQTFDDRIGWRRFGPGGWKRSSDGATVSPTHRPPWGWFVEIPNSDGSTTENALHARDLPAGRHVLEEVDRQWPAPLPPILVGQVWAAEDGEVSIVAVARTRDPQDPIAAILAQPGPHGDPILDVIPGSAFADLVLVRGDHSPWAPPGFTDWPVEEEGGEE